MGKIADRLARKKNPQFETARTIVKLAVNATNFIDDDSWDELHALLEHKLETMIPEGFEVLMSEVFAEANPRRDGEDVLDEVDAIVNDLAETYAHADGLTSHLVALPLIITHSAAAWDVRITESQAAALIGALKSHSLVADEAKVTVFPRMLSTGEAANLYDGTVYSLTRALAEQNLDEAAALVATDLAETGIVSMTGNLREGDSAASSFGVLVVLVTSTDMEPFPVTMELRHVLESMSNDALYEDNEQYEANAEGEVDFEDEPVKAADASADTQAAFDDVLSILKAFSAEAATILNVKTAQLVEEPQGWYAGVARAGTQERLIVANLAIKELAREHTDSDTSKLCVSGNLVAKNSKTPAFEIKFYRTSDLVFVGTVSWPMLASESFDRCQDELVDYLERENWDCVEDLRDSPAVKSPLARTKGGKSLH